MAIGVLYGGDGSTVMYNFESIERIDAWESNATGVSEIELPGLADSWSYDFKMRKEPFSFVFTTLPTTYQSGGTNRGTGTFMDQWADLLYLFRNQGYIIQNNKYGAFGDVKAWYFTITMHSTAAINASHVLDPLSIGDDTGFVAGASTYWLKCGIRNVKLLSMDPIQKMCKIHVSLYKTNTIIGI